MSDDATAASFVDEDEYEMIQGPEQGAYAEIKRLSTRAAVEAVIKGAGFGCGACV